MDISTREIALNTLKNVNGNNVGFLTIEITPKKAWENNMVFSTSNYIAKSMWKSRRFLDQQNYVKKVRGNDSEIRRNLLFDKSA